MDLQQLFLMAPICSTFQVSAGGSAAYALQQSASFSELKGPEVNAPVYPVDIKHNFPPEAPPREEAPGHDDLQYPVLGVEGKHQYQEKTPAPLDTKELHGPSYEIERQHS